MRSAGNLLRKHVNDIAEKYLISGEVQTPAIMFVPSESLYADLHDGFPDVIQKARRANVIVVSPNILMLAINTIQSIAQVHGTYGDAEAQTIIENCGNTLILRYSASERGGTAEFASRLIGKREVMRRHVSHSRPTADNWDRTVWASGRS